jgi:hypothetical protein
MLNMEGSIVAVGAVNLSTVNTLTAELLPQLRFVLRVTPFVLPRPGSPVNGRRKSKGVELY